MATNRYQLDDAEPAPGVRRVLVVDDSRSQRRILKAYLSRWGYEVLEAETGDAALELCRNHSIDLVLSDWMMPGMNGLEFCTAYRALPNHGYGYFILLTSKSEKGEVAHGLDMGADDFLTKPVAAMELRARIIAGERILKMERQLLEKNRLVHETLEEISSLYEALDRDLIEARKLQQSLVRETHSTFDTAEISLLLHPSGHVGGDLVGFFEISKSRIGFFSIDVSGHGMASALMTARLAAYLSGSSPDQNLALKLGAGGMIEPRAPEDVARALNRMMLEEMDTELYFTMMLAWADLNSGKVDLVQCGHPRALVQRIGGEIEFFGEGGFPVGLIPDACWKGFQLKLNPGDRLLLVSDGVTECPTNRDEMLEENGLKAIVRRNDSLSGASFLDALLWDLSRCNSDRPFSDDVSAVLLAFSDSAASR